MKVGKLYRVIFKWPAGGGHAPGVTMKSGLLESSFIHGGELLLYLGNLPARYQAEGTEREYRWRVHTFLRAKDSKKYTWNEYTDDNPNVSLRIEQVVELAEE
jgi:hypothetical protein